MPRFLNPARAVYRFLNLPNSAKVEHVKDSFGLPRADPGTEAALREAIAWIARAQDHSASRDGGVAHSFSLIDGWRSSYPETTGYIVPTMLAYARASGNPDARRRAERMLDWLVSIQFSDGSFQGGKIGAKDLVPVAFNTGQILLGLTAGVREFGDCYHEAMRKAADWLVGSQDAGGAWSRNCSPFAIAGPKSYDTHIAWALFEAARLEPGRPYPNAAAANVRWSLTFQHENGWFANCDLENFDRPSTHTLGYALRGLIEAYTFTEDPTLLESCRKTGDGLLLALKEDGFLPGRLYSDWSSDVRWVCLTGSAQVASCWLSLYQATGHAPYKDAARAVNRFLRRTLNLSSSPGVRGGVKGAFPVNGAFHPYQYINWGAKFLADSLLQEMAIENIEPAVSSAPTHANVP